MRLEKTFINENCGTCYGTGMVGTHTKFEDCPDCLRLQEEQKEEEPKKGRKKGTTSTIKKTTSAGDQFEEYFKKYIRANVVFNDENRVVKVTTSNGDNT